MPAPRPKQPDQSRLIASLAAECQIPVGEMTKLYEHERAELAVGAHVAKYLHIFASRNVLEIVRKRGLVRPTSKPADAGIVAPLAGARPLLPA